jgi:hypothetical protein
MRVRGHGRDVRHGRYEFNIVLSVEGEQPVRFQVHLWQPARAPVLPEDVWSVRGLFARVCGQGQQLSDVV